MEDEVDPKVPVNTIASVMPTFIVDLNVIKILRKCSSEVDHQEYHNRLTKSDRARLSSALARK